MNEGYVFESGYLSLNKKGEELCGDHIQYLDAVDGTKALVLADGLGSGVKASILSTLASTILCTMMESGLSIEQAVSSLVASLPVARDRGNIAYSTFTVILVKDGERVLIYNYDNPLPIYLRNGKELHLSYSEEKIEGKPIMKAETDIRLGDCILALSDGCIYAGVGETLNFGWTRKEIVNYLEGLYDPSFSAKNIATLVVSRCKDLYNGHPGDDTSAACLRLRSRSQCNVVIGPPTNKEDDAKMLNLFFAKRGRHISCGGTTAKIVSNFLGSPVIPSLTYEDREIPPTSEIKGMDLVTEGVITLNRVLSLADDYLGSNEKYFDWAYRQDGASRIAKMLFEEATDIDFFVGCAVNAAHQDPRYNIGINMKMQIVERLGEKLKAMGKRVKIAYF